MTKIYNYVGIELDSLDELIEKVRNMGSGNHKLQLMADYFFTEDEDWDAEDIIENMENYRDADLDDSDMGDFRRILGGVKVEESK